MTAEVSQVSVLSLENTDASAQLSQLATLVLWTELSSAEVSQVCTLVLRRNHGLRVIGVTD